MLTWSRVASVGCEYMSSCRILLVFMSREWGMRTHIHSGLYIYFSRLTMLHKAFHTHHRCSMQWLHKTQKWEIFLKGEL